MRPIYIYKLVVTTHDDCEELNAEETLGAIRHELAHTNYLNVVGIEWEGTIEADKANIILKGEINE